MKNDRECHYNIRERLTGRRTRVSPWGIGALAVGGTVLPFSDPERRKVLGKYITPIVQSYSTEFQRARVQEQRGLDGLREVLLAAPAAPTSKQQVAIVLARQHEPLLAKEIQERMLTHFARDLVPTVAEVRSVLRNGSEFVQPERYRWQFGRLAGPWRVS